MEPKRKKVGVITLYYRSFNCGGLLQAYALIKVLQELGADAEQISYDRIWDSRQNRYKRAMAMPLKKIFRKCVQKAGHKIKKQFLRRKNKDLEEDFRKRIRAAEDFAEKIPHSKRVYNRENIGRCVKDYDLFIAGSDQIWNPDLLQPAFLLDFVPEGKKKIAYGASISQFTLKKDDQDILRRGLASFDGVSVREKQALQLLCSLTAHTVEWVLDPTLLLPRKHWETFCQKPVINGSYILCYFLGADKRLRSLAKQVSEHFELPVITMPFLQNRYSRCDVGFGDIRLYDAGPEEFLSLIRYADYVLTDSFHGAVFAEVFDIRYAVFDRRGESGMSSRIESLVQLLDSEQRFIRNPGKISAEELETRLNEKKVERDMGCFENMRRQSMMYLERYLK